MRKVSKDKSGNKTLENPKSVSEQFGRPSENQLTWSHNSNTDEPRIVDHSSERTSSSNTYGNRSQQIDRNSGSSRWWGSHSFPPQELLWEFDADALNGQTTYSQEDIGPSHAYKLPGQCGGLVAHSPDRIEDCSHIPSSYGQTYDEGPTIWPDQHSYSKDDYEVDSECHFVEQNYRQEKNSSGSSGTRRRMLHVLICLLALGCAAYYLVYIDGYKVDADISFMCPDSEPSLSDQLPLQKETYLLKHPKLLHRVARELVEIHPSLAQNCGRRYASVVNFGAPARSSSSDTLSSLSDTNRVVRWLSERLHVTVQPEAGLATVSMAGPDPDLMKTVVSSYVKHYSTYRLALLSKEQQLAAYQPSAPPAPLHSDDLITVLNDLQKVDSQMHECRLALQLMGSGSGPFRGFLPDNGVIGVPALNRFKSRIIELELKKRSLGVRYKPDSRDVRSIDLEIAGIRKAMQERIQEHIVFLQKRKQELVALQKSVEERTRAAVYNNMHRARPLRAATEASTLPVRNCVHMQGEPFIAKKPLIIKAGELARGFFTGTIASEKRSLFRKKAVAKKRSDDWGLSFVSTAAGKLVAALEDK